MTSMDIVDAQIHMGPGGIAELEASMDALGINAVLIAEKWGHGVDDPPQYQLENGTRRPIAPTAQLASMLKPRRFSWLLRMNPTDPEFAALIRLVRDAPEGRAIRITPGISSKTMRAFASGEYDNILAAAADCDLPVFVFAPDQPQCIARVVEKFPDLQLIVDHCGISSNAMRVMLSGSAPLDEAAQLALFDQVVALSQYPNVALKWCHASHLFGKPGWQNEALWPILRRAIDHFGAERIMWASDHTVNQEGETWAEILFAMRRNADLTDTEKALIFGATIRRILNWPASRPS